jgi:hypothetical protein
VGLVGRTTSYARTLDFTIPARITVAVLDDCIARDILPLEREQFAILRLPSRTHPHRLGDRGRSRHEWEARASSESGSDAMPSANGPPRTRTGRL